MASHFMPSMARRLQLGLSASLVCLPAAPSRLFSNFSTESKAIHEADEHMSLKDEMIKEEKKAKRAIEETKFPDKFPFELIDNLGEEKITLKRNAFGENIEVEVGLDCSSSDCSLSIMIDKGEDTNLEFSCKLQLSGATFSWINAKAQKVLYDTGKYEEPFGIKVNLERTAGKYLEERGIDSSLGQFLVDYFRIKTGRDLHYNWLKNSIDFIVKPSAFLE